LILLPQFLAEYIFSLFLFFFDCYLGKKLE